MDDGATEKWTREGEIPSWLHWLHQSSRVLAKSRSDRRRFVSLQSLDMPIYTPSPHKPGMSASAADVTALYAGECVAQISDQISAAQVVEQLAA